MEITQAHLEQRLTAIQSQLRQHQTNVTACEGAIQILQSLLQDLQQPEPPAAEKV